MIFHLTEIVIRLSSGSYNHNLLFIAVVYININSGFYNILL